MMWSKLFLLIGMLAMASAIDNNNKTGFKHATEKLNQEAEAAAVEKRRKLGGSEDSNSDDYNEIVKERRHCKEACPIIGYGSAGLPIRDQKCLDQW